VTTDKDDVRWRMPSRMDTSLLLFRILQ